MARYAISDIHGCSKSFKALLEKIDFSKNDTLFLLGDYIDRGPDSKGVLDIIFQLESDGFDVRCLRGNHEQMFLGDYDSPYRNIGHLSIFNAKEKSEIPQQYIKWMKALPYYFETPGYILVHAGLDFESNNPLTECSDMMWIRNWYKQIDREWLGDRIIIHGHTPTPKTTIISQLKQLSTLPALDIDAGCSISGKSGFNYLVAFNLDDRSLIFQESLDLVYH